MASVTDERYTQLVEYLRGSKIGSPVYPTGFSANDKRGLRQQPATFEEKDGILYHSRKGKLRRVIVDPAEKARLIRACHDGIDGGHFGRDKTMSKVMLLSNASCLCSSQYFSVSLPCSWKRIGGKGWPMMLLSTARGVMFVNMSTVA